MYVPERAEASEAGSGSGTGECGFANVAKCRCYAESWDWKKDRSSQPGGGSFKSFARRAS